MIALPNLIGECASIRGVRRVVDSLLERQASGRPPVPVLIRGETGTGKGLLSRELVAAGARAQAPFVPVNCAAIPENLLEAELFGYERGAFTDARTAKAGLFQSAHRGTVFLDEIGFLPLSLQAKLLAAVEDRAVRRIGSTRAEPMDVWLISATNADLLGAIREGTFLEALYHRLAVVRIELPPLRERGDDVLLLAEHFLRTLCEEHGIARKRLSGDACIAIESHRWPGNVRELHNTIQRAVLLTEGAEVSAGALGLGAPPRSRRRTSSSGELASPERTELLAVLEQVGWNLSRAATALGVPRNTLRYRMEKLRLRRTSELPAAVPADEGTTLEIALDPDDAREAPGATARFFESAALHAVAAGARVLERGSVRLVAGFAAEPFEEAPECAARCALAILRDRERERALGRRLPLPRLRIDRAGSPRRDEGSPGAIVVGDELLPSLARRFELHRDGAHHVLRERAELAVPAKTPFVGRAAELALLASAVAEAAEGRGRTIALSGEPGMGASRLVTETIGRLPERVRAIHARATPAGRARPYALIADLLRAIGTTPDDPVLARLLRDGPEGNVAGAAARAPTAEAFARFVLGHACEETVVLIVEDVHAIDVASDEALAVLAERSTGARLVVLATFRAPYRPAWLDASGATHLVLAPLSERETELLVRGCAGNAARAVARAGGNPCFAELLAEPGGEAIAERIAAARIARLPADARHVLQIASILDARFELPELAALVSEHDVGPIVRVLRRHELLISEPDAAAERWRFRHPLVRDVAEASTSPDERRATHLAAARVLEAAHGDGLDRQAARIAHHYEQGAELESALDWTERANRAALRTSKIDAAHATYEKACALLAALPPTRANQRRHLALLIDQPVMFMGRMKLGEYRDLLRQHEATARALAEPGLLGQLESRLGWAEWALGDTPAAIELLDRAAELCATAQLDHDVGIAQLGGGWAHLLAGELERALELETQALARLCIDRDPHAHAAAHAGRAWVLAEMGRFREAEQAGRRALRLAEDAGDDGLVSFAAWGLSRTYGIDGETTQALEVARLAMARATTPIDVVLAGCHVGWALCRSGEAQRGVELLGELLSNGQRSGFAFIDEFSPYLGEGLVQLGELDRAHALFERCFEVGRARGQRLATGRAQRWLGEVALRRGDRSKARAELEHAAAILRPIGARSELARAESLLAAL